MINPSFKNFDLSLKRPTASRDLDIASGSGNSARLEYKIEKIDSEIATMKNMIMQVAINTNQINSKDIELIRYDIRNLKENIDDLRDNSDIKRLKAEIAAIKEFTEDLVDAQKDNNEKVKKFIDNYYKQTGITAKRKSTKGDE